jgi:hypothetical protein
MDQSFGYWLPASGHWLRACDQMIKSQLPAARDQQPDFEPLNLKTEA